jgi:hypothetical protein
MLVYVASSGFDLFIMKKKVFCNWPCNSLYLHAMNVNGQVAIHHIYNVIHCNSIATPLKQLIFNYYPTPL